MLACTMGNIEIVKILIVNQSININQEDNAGINALYVATYYGYINILKLLKNLGGEFKPSVKGTTVLHIACKKGYIDIVRYLLHDVKDIDVNARKVNGLTPAMLAVAKNHLFVLRMLKE